MPQLRDRQLRLWLLQQQLRALFPFPGPEPLTVQPERAQPRRFYAILDKFLPGFQVTKSWRIFVQFFKKRVPPSLSKITKHTTGLLKGAGKGAFRILKAAREDPFGLTLRGIMEVEKNDPEDLAWDNNDIGPWDQTRLLLAVQALSICSINES